MENHEEVPMDDDLPPANDRDNEKLLTFEKVNTVVCSFFFYRLKLFLKLFDSSRKLLLIALRRVYIQCDGFTASAWLKIASMLLLYVDIQ